MELRRIPLEDVYPDEANPRSKESMGDIAALADSFALNAVNPGEPVNPIVVVADGGIYRIVDGERRYRAMRSLKKTDCMAVVCEGMDEANAMLAMLATDDKERLTDAERSRGVQQMLLLGVDPEQVEKAGRMAKGSARRVRRAMAMVDDAAEDMSLDRLVAISEFEGDPEAVARLENCSEQEWRRVRDDMMREREAEALEESLRGAAASAGLAVSDDPPDGMRYDGRANDPERVREMAAELPAGSVGSISATRWGGVWLEMYVPESSDSEAEREAAERSRRRDELDDAAMAGAQRRAEWFARRVEAGTYGSGSVARLLEAEAAKPGKGQYYAREMADWVGDFAEAAGTEPPRFGWTPWLACYAYQRYARSLGESPSIRRDGTVDAKDAGAWLDWLGACVDDGYGPCEADETLKKACVAAFDDDTDE